MPAEETNCRTTKQQAYNRQVRGMSVKYRASRLEVANTTTRRMRLTQNAQRTETVAAVFTVASSSSGSPDTCTHGTRVQGKVVKQNL
jgi:hypothetical protein